MPRRRELRRWLFPARTVILMIAILVPFWVAAAPGSSGTVQQVDVGTYVTFTGQGFQANEPLSLWATSPDGNTVPLDGTQADGNGGFSISVSFPSAGMWQVTAHGNTSGIEYAGQYAVGTGTAPPSASVPTSAVPTSRASTPTAAASAPTGSTSSTSSGTVPPGLPPGTQSASPGASVTFSGTGFTAGEMINIWVTGPDSTVTPLNTISADGSGGANGTATLGSGGGLWQITMHGKDSAHEVVTRYYVAGGTLPIPTSTASGSTSSSTIPAGSVPPGLPPGTQAAAPGVSVTFTGSGFNSNEALGIWVTGPDSTVTALNSAYADSSGSTSGSTAFGTAGLWQVTIHGKDSGHEVINRFYVSGDATSSSSTSSPTGTATGTPTVGPASNTSIVKVPASQRVTFTVTGFTPNEVVSIWTTSPEGTVSGLDGTQANNLGRVIVTTTFPTAGLWQITAHGQSSGHEAIGQYQVTAST